MAEAKTGRGAKKASDEELLSSYRETNSVWQTARRFGMCGQSVHERLARLGVARKQSTLNKEDRAIIETEYQGYASRGKLADLAGRLGRTKHSVCRYAGQMGLTDKNRPKAYISTWKYMPEDEAAEWFKRFKKSPLGLNKFCAKNDIDDLGFSRTMKRFFPAEYESLIELKAPKSSLYKLGRSFEYRVRDMMREHGYFVTRSPQSRSPVDLTCIRKDSIVVVQCKRGGQFHRQEWNEFYRLATSIGAEPILATMPETKTRGIKLYRLVGEKDGSKRAQPWVVFQFPDTTK